MLSNAVFSQKYIVKLWSLLVRDERSCWIVQSVIGVTFCWIFNFIGVSSWTSSRALS